MKKILIIIGVLLLTCACSSSYFKSINLKTLNKMLDNKESFVLYLHDNDGDTLKNTLSSVSKKNKIKSYSINTAKLNENDLKNLKNIFTFEDTNIIIFVKKGYEETVLSRIDDLYISEKNLEQELINQGYIK